MKNKCNFVEGKTYQSLIRMFLPLMAAILKPIYGINGIWMAFLISHILAFVTGLLMLKAEKDLLFSCTDI